MIHQTKTHRATSLTLLLMIAALAFQLGIASAIEAQGRATLAQTATASRTTPRTVLDFYMLLTPEEFTPLEVIKNRKSIIEVQDIGNGYLKLKNNPDWDGSAEIALFKKTDGSYLVALAETSCGPICSTSLKFLQYQNNRWLEVTDQVMPELPDALLLTEYRRVTGSGGRFDPIPVLYTLPRVGKTIKVGIDSDADDEPGHPHYEGDGTVLKLRWDGERLRVIRN